MPKESRFKPFVGIAAEHPIRAQFMCGAKQDYAILGLEKVIAAWHPAFEYLHCLPLGLSNVQ
jgi:hypothetical protein